jgi:LDH2 family malate/lactate/ureidoglycolate dehydrogenase
MTTAAGQEDAGTIRVEAARLSDYCSGILCGLGTPEAQSEIVADSLVEANLRGVACHGANLVALYVSRIRDGAVHPKTEIRERVDELIRDMRRCEPAPGVERIYAPGEIEHLKRLDAVQKGIRMAANVIAELEGFGRELGMGPLLAEGA